MEMAASFDISWKSILIYANKALPRRQMTDIMPA